MASALAAATIPVHASGDFAHSANSREWPGTPSGEIGMYVLRPRPLREADHLLREPLDAGYLVGVIQQPAALDPGEQLRSLIGREQPVGLLCRSHGSLSATGEFMFQVSRAGPRGVIRADPAGPRAG